MCIIWFFEYVKSSVSIGIAFLTELNVKLFCIKTFSSSFLCHILQCSYCECFAAGLYCVEPCSCQDCLNKPIHENIVLETRKQIESRNPLAFAPKVIRSVDAVPEYGVSNCP